MVLTRALCSEDAVSSCQNSRNYPSAMVLGRSPSSGKLFPETSLVVDAPSAYFCPLSGSLMLEPVTLVNTGQVRRTSHSQPCCLITASCRVRGRLYLRTLWDCSLAHMGLLSALHGATLGAPLLCGCHVHDWQLPCPWRIYLAYPQWLTAACPTCAGL